MVQGTTLTDTKTITLTIKHECSHKLLKPDSIPTIKLKSNLIQDQTDTYDLMNLYWKPSI